MQYDTTLGGAGFDPVDDILAENVGLVVPHFTNSILGSPYTTIAGTEVGHTGTLSTDIVDGGTSASFNDFERGEGFVSISLCGKSREALVRTSAPRGSAGPGAHSECVQMDVREAKPRDPFILFPQR